MQRIINYFLLLLITFNIFFVSLGAYLYPIASIDAVSIWYLKAKAFYLNNGHIPLEILKDNFYLNTHPQYPLLLPFAFYLLYAILGGVHDEILAFLNPVLYLLILIIVYRLLIKLQFPQVLTLLFTYIYSMFSPLLAQGGRKHSGDADIFIVFLNWLAIFFSYKFIKYKNYNFFYLLIAIIMISSQIKAEGILLASILLFIPVSKKLKLFSIALSLIPFVLWRMFISYYNIPNDFYFILPSLQEMTTRSFEIFYYTFKEMLKINNWYIFWPVFFFFIIFIKSKNNFIKKFILPSLLSYCALFFISYLLSSISLGIYVPTSIDRILLQLSPFYYLIFVYSVRESKILQQRRTSKLKYRRGYLSIKI